jgi:hypothetical protein
MIARYVIKKFTSFNLDNHVVAHIEVDTEGGLRYEMVSPDSDVERVLMQAKQDGGLPRPIPFHYESKEGLALAGLKQRFVPVTDLEHFGDAIEYNLENCMVDQE